MMSGGKIFYIIFFVVIKNCDTYNVDYVAMKTKMTTTTTAAATSHIPHVTLYFR